MRTVLTRILTAFLAASTTLSVSATPQVMKKAGGNANRISVTSTVKPQAAKAQGKTKGLVGLNMLQKRTSKLQFSLRSGATKLHSSRQEEDCLCICLGTPRDVWQCHLCRRLEQ